jgi:hypothetical protein
MDNPTKYIGLIGGGLAIIVSSYKGVTFTHDTIQLIEEQGREIAKLDKDLEQVRGAFLVEQIKGEIKWLQRRMFRIEEVYGDDVRKASGLVYEEYKQSKIDMDNLQQELKSTQRTYKALR